MIIFFSLKLGSTVLKNRLTASVCQMKNLHHSNSCINEKRGFFFVVVKVIIGVLYFK